MRTVLYILTVMAVIALAFWSYQENYETRKALNDADSARGEIQLAHARLGVLRAEWAYLNRPSRLLDLAELTSTALACCRWHRNSLVTLSRLHIHQSHCWRS